MSPTTNDQLDGVAYQQTGFRLSRSREASIDRFAAGGLPQYRSAMQVEGACLCDAVRYVAEVDPGRVFLCHCTDCQIHSGCMMSWSVPVLGSTFTLVRGELKLF